MQFEEGFVAAIVPVLDFASLIVVEFAYFELQHFAKMLVDMLIAELPSLKVGSLENLQKLDEFGAGME